MNLQSTIRRAKRGFREEFRLYMVAVFSLTVAFLCLGGSMLAVANLNAIGERFGDTGRVTVYLKDDAAGEDISRLGAVLEGLPEVASVEYWKPAEARAHFLEETDLASELSSIPKDAFPASLEVTLRSGRNAPRTSHMVQRIREFRAVQDVERYDGFYRRVDSLVAAGRGIALAVCLLVGIGVLAVIGNTIRLAVARRRREIEVMKLCGATDRFVRDPFVLEGVFQGVASSLVAVAILALVFVLLREQVDSALSVLLGGKSVFLHPLSCLALLGLGAFTGAIGSALSVRRYLAV